METVGYQEENCCWVTPSQHSLQVSEILGQRDPRQAISAQLILCHCTLPQPSSPEEREVSVI